MMQFHDTFAILTLLALSLSLSLSHAERGFNYLVQIDEFKSFIIFIMYIIQYNNIIFILDY